MLIKRIPVLILAVVLIAAGSGNAQHSMQKTFTVKKGDNLTVKVLGDIEIDSWTKEEVFVEVGGLDSKEDEEAVLLTQAGNTVSVVYEMSKGYSSDLQFVIHVPENFNLALKTNGGAVICHGAIEGNVTAKTAGGNIEVGQVKGPVDLKTAGGDISAGNIDGDVNLVTSGGDITTGNIKGYARITTSGGDIKIGSVGGELKAATSGGDIWVGTANGYAKLTSSGGDILIEKSLQAISINTSGGSITMNECHGSINANTSGGDIQAEVVATGSEDSKITTSGGKITLMIGEHLKAFIKATINVSSWNNDSEYKVYSDFKETIHNTSESESTYEYNLNGGGSLIRLRTTGSDIYIKKLMK